MSNHATFVFCKALQNQRPHDPSCVLSRRTSVKTYPIMSSRSTRCWRRSSPWSSCPIRWTSSWTSAACSSSGISYECLCWFWKRGSCRVSRTPTATTPASPTYCRPSAGTTTRSVTKHNLNQQYYTIHKDRDVVMQYSAWSAEQTYILDPVAKTANTNMKFNH